jgi:hypothetical protein
MKATKPRHITSKAIAELMKRGHIPYNVARVIIKTGQEAAKLFKPQLNP